MLRRDVLLGVSALAAVGRRLAGASTNYNAGIAEWRKNYDRDLRSEKGSLWLIARNNVPEGKTGIGSDPSNRVALPDRAPKFAGTIQRQGSKVNFVPAAGNAVTLNGKPMSDADVPKDGKVIMDFNKAYNPYCAFNPYSSCPIPPKYNTLTTRVEAGEKYSGAH